MQNKRSDTEICSTQLQQAMRYGKEMESLERENAAWRHKIALYKDELAQKDRRISELEENERRRASTASVPGPPELQRVTDTM